MDTSISRSLTPARGAFTFFSATAASAFTDRAVAGSSPLNVLTAGDLNDDGWADVAAASTSASSVTIFTGGGAGFHQPQTYTTGVSPRGVVIADVNQDGGLDVVTANRGSSTVSVLLADRDQPGRFLPQAPFAAGSGSRDVVAADFDADGRVNLATGNEFAGAVTVLANTTLFTRAAYVLGQQSLTPGGEHFSQSGNHVWSADFNRDGTADVVMARDLADDEPWALSVLLTGVGIVPLPQTGYPVALVVADVNGDGNADVVYHARDGAVRADIGDGRGGFTASAPTVSSFVPGGPRGMATGDLNRDGRQDLFMVGFDPSTGDFSIRAFFGDGRGAFRAATPIPLGAGFSNAIAAVADLNRDGKPDVAALSVNDGFTAHDVLRVWFGDGGGGLSAPAVIPISGLNSEHVMFDDVNRDGYVDAVVIGQGGVSVALGGAGGLGAPVHTSQSTLCAPVPFGTGACWAGSKASTLADIDADGALDIVTAGGDFVHGGGDGTFGPTSSFDYGGVDAAVVDMTRDGLPDIVSISAMGDVDLVVNQRNDVNRPPAVSAGPDRTIQYQQQFGHGECFVHEAIGRDPDLHALALEWRASNGDLISQERAFNLCGELPGTYRYRLKVDDFRGGVVNDSVLLTIAPGREIVLHVVEPPAEYGSSRQWSPVADATGAGLMRAYNANAKQPKVTAPRVDPGANYLLLRFVADPTQTYKLWLRLKADNNSWANDSVWVQFSGASDAAGTPKYRIGTTGGLSVSLEECVNCGVSGWGWEDDGWGAVNKNGVLLRFPEGGEQMMLIQTREDGVSLDQVVLSARKYLTARPGTAKNDTTILPQTGIP